MRLPRATAAAALSPRAGLEAGKSDRRKNSLENIQARTRERMAKEVDTGVLRSDDVAGHGDR